MTTSDAEEIRGLRDELVRAQNAARVARRRIDELEAAVARSADAVAERDLIRDRSADVEAATARAEAASARADVAEAAERTLAEIHASRVWRTVQRYDRVTRRLRRS